MPIQLFIGFTVEGSTDTKFLTEIIEKVFTETALECRTDVTIEDVRIIDVPKSSFVETMIEASKRALCHYGISILCIHREPESYADPKQIICDAIRLAQSSRTKRRRNNLTINDLYSELGQSLSMDDLRRIPSFCSFEDKVKSAFSELGYFG